VHSIREDKKGISEEKRYFISSLSPDARKIGEGIRAHWGIENSLHWILDTAFNEDQSRVRSGNAAENLSIIRKVALNMVKKAPRKKLSVNRFLYQASLNPNALKQIIAVK
jgi:predicted transposase YbfD/YdcC